MPVCHPAPVSFLPSVWLSFRFSGLILHESKLNLHVIFNFCLLMILRMNTCMRKSTFLKSSFYISYIFWSQTPPFSPSVLEKWNKFKFIRVCSEMIIVHCAQRCTIHPRIYIQLLSLLNENNNYKNIKNKQTMARLRPSSKKSQFFNLLYDHRSTHVRNIRLRQVHTFTLGRAEI